MDNPTSATDGGRKSQAYLLHWSKHLESLGFVTFPAQLTWNEARGKYDKKPRYSGWQSGNKGQGFHDGDVIGVVMPPNTILLDLDKVAEFERRGLPHNGTFSQKTSRGRHEMYRTDGRNVQTSQNGDFDIKVAGLGWAVAWEPETWVPVDQWALAPEWVYTWKARKDPSPTDGLIPPGERHQHYLSLAGSLHNLGLSEDAILAALRAENAKRSPDHADDDLVNIAASVGQWDRKASGVAPSGLVFKTGLEMEHGPTPEQLVDPFLSPNGTTIIYGQGEVGKGVTACWLAQRLIRGHGMKVLVLDTEDNEWEWGHRTRAMGYTDAELAESFRYVGPKDALARSIDRIRDYIAEQGITYVFVDSYSMSAGTGGELGGLGAATDFFRLLKTLEVPNCLIAHLPADSPRFPEKPFGSIQVRNQARCMWAIERVTDDWKDPEREYLTGGGFVDDVVSIELRNTKFNTGSRRDTQFLTYTFGFAPESITVDRSSPASRKTTRDLITAVLKRSKDPMTNAQIVKAIKDNTGVVLKTETVTRKLTTYFHKVEDGTTDKWTL